MNRAAISDTALRELFRQAATWRLLGLLFERPGPLWRRDVERVVGEIDDPELTAAAAAAQRQATAGGFDSTFAPCGPAPVREVACRTELELGSLMAELDACYEAFGYRPASEEPPDHISVEAGFLGYLFLKQAYAVLNDEPEKAALAAEAARCFARDHLEPLAAALTAALLGSGSCWEPAAEALCRRLGALP